MVGTGSLEVSPHPPTEQPGVVPAVSCRLEHRFGPVWLGGTFEGGVPSWYGDVLGAVSAEVEHRVRPAACVDETCAPSIALAAGVDAGVTAYFFAANTLSELGDTAGLQYWGPIGRARGELRVMWECPNEGCPEGFGTAVGVVVGASAALTSAHYLGGGVGARVEPGLEVGLVLRL